MIASRAGDRVAEDVHAAAAHLRLVNDESIRREVSTSAGLATPLYAAVWQAGELLVSPQLSRICACPGTGCGWLFLDRSGRRRWCTMSTCGNRAKARRFLARTVHRTDRHHHQGAPGLGMPPTTRSNEVLAEPICLSIS